MVATKKTLKEQTREYIMELIRERNLQPGDRLPPQRELSRILNVSPKIPEVVLNELEAEQLVERHGRKGTFISSNFTGVPRPAPAPESPNVFIILPNLRNPHFVEYAAQAEAALHRKMRTMQIMTGDTFSNPQDMIDQMVRAGTGGIIAIHSTRQLREFAHRHNVPIVELRYQTVGLRSMAKGLFVVPDLRMAAKQLGEHMLSLGHRDIYLAGDLPMEGFSDCRFKIIQEMVEKKGGRVRILPQKYPIPHYRSYEAIGAELAQTMLAEGLPATGAIFFNSPRAVGAMRFLQREGVRIPEDFSIAGFGESFQAGFPEPEITASIHNNVIGSAVSMLLAAGSDFKTVVIDPVLKQGSSCAAARKEVYR